MSDDQAARILNELHELRSEVRQLTANGCAHGWQHKDHGDRILVLERQAAEMRGKSAIAGGAVAVIASAVFTWIGRRL